MRVLITGATGFLGSHFALRLARDGHQVVCAVRNPDAARRTKPQFDYVQVDFTRAVDTASWLPHLQGVEVVVNAVGILRESPGQTFELLHRRAPCALFAACADAGVRRVIQISALGADDEARSAYHLSKRDADRFLLGLAGEGIVVQPSLVFGTDGASARLFCLLASCPLLPLPGGGAQQIQPVHVDDLADVVAALAAGARPPARRFAVAGPRALSLRDFLAVLRKSLGIRRPARVLAVPMGLAFAGARLAAGLPGALVDPATLEMLNRGNTAPAAATRALLGRDPRPVERFIDSAGAELLRQRALLAWLLPLLRAALGTMWIVTALLSFGLYPVQESYALLARSGVPAALQPLALYGAATLDLILGVLCFVPWRRERLWLAQGALILAYTAIISLRLPEFWLHPYGPILKNLPLLAAIWLLYELEPHRWNT